MLCILFKQCLTSNRIFKKSKFDHYNFVLCMQYTYDLEIKINNQIASKDNRFLYEASDSCGKSGHVYTFILRLVVYTMLIILSPLTFEGEWKQSLQESVICFIFTLTENKTFLWRMQLKLSQMTMQRIQSYHCFNKEEDTCIHTEHMAKNLISLFLHIKKNNK